VIACSPNVAATQLVPLNVCILLSLLVWNHTSPTFLPVVDGCVFCLKTEFLPSAVACTSLIDSSMSPGWARQSSTMLPRITCGFENRSHGVPTEVARVPIINHALSSDQLGLKVNTAL